jgi:hypothetical protein
MVFTLHVPAATCMAATLTVSNLDIMAQNYSFNTDVNSENSFFSIQGNILKDKNSTIWSSAYNAIGNCNQILQVR